MAGFTLLVSLLIIVVGIVALAIGHLRPLRIHSRRSAGAVIIAGVVLFIVAAALAPPSQTSATGSTALVAGPTSAVASAAEATSTAPVPATAAPTVTSSPLPTPKPATATPRLPPATPRPPTPTPRPTPGLPQDDIAYLATVLPHVKAAQDGLNVISTQSAIAAQNIAVIRDADWETTSVLALAELEAAGQGLQEKRAVPADFRQMDALLQTTGKELVNAAQDYAHGVDDVSATELESAVTHIDNVKAAIAQASKQLDAVNQRYGVAP